MKLIRYRVRRSDGVTHAFWANEAEAAQLVREGLAVTFGTRRRIAGLRLKCEAIEARTALFGSPRTPGCGVHREHVAKSFYIYQHSRPASAASEHLRLAA